MKRLSKEEREQIREERRFRLKKEYLEATNLIISNKDDIRHIKDGTLFYPCSGEDWKSVVQMFFPLVTEFWFVDIQYLQLRLGIRRFSFNLSSKFRLIEESLDGVIKAEHRTKEIDAETNETYRYLEPATLTRKWVHIESKKTITIHFVRNNGYCGLEKNIPQNSLDIFLYRGDSMGEGGSGMYWFRKSNYKRILGKLKENGLIVTDGSNLHYTKKTYVTEQFQQYHRKPKLETETEIIETIESFESAKDHFSKTKCIGYAGHRYGSVFIWKLLENKVTESPKLTGLCEKCGKC